MTIDTAETTATTAPGTLLPTPEPEPLEAVAAADRAALDVRCDQAALARALDVVVHAAAGGRTAVLPVLANVLLRAETGPSQGALPDGRLTVACTDLTTWLSTSVPAAVTQAGAVTVPARLLADLAASLPAGPVALVGQATHLRVTGTHVTTTLKTIDADEFPAAPDLTDLATCTLPASALRQALALLLPSVAKDDSRPVLSCLNLVLRPDAPVLGQTADGFRLAHWTQVAPTPADWPTDTDAWNLLVHRDSLRRLPRVLPKASPAHDADAASADDVPVTLALAKNGGQVFLRLPAGTDVAAEPVLIGLRLSEGQFPGLERVIPKAPAATTVTVGRLALIAVMQRAQPFARDAADVLTLAIGGEGIRVSAQAAQVGSYDEALVAGVTGEALTVSLNATYLLELLAPLPGDTLVVDLHGPMSPIRLTDPTVPGLTLVVMPIHTVARAGGGANQGTGGA